MAAVEHSETADKQFACGICIGSYRNPRYLPTCGHTFCERCLLKYAKNIQQESIGSKFDCPVCRKPTNLPIHNEVTLKWIQTFPLNTVIIKMMESMPRYSEDMAGERNLCEPCREDGETNAGLKYCLDCKEVLCKACTKYHNNSKLSKDHKLIDVGEIANIESRTNVFSGVGKCVDHPDRDVEIYCQSHDAVICSMCSTFQHKACAITEIGGHSIDVTELQKTSEMLSIQMEAAIEHLNFLQKLRVEVKDNLKQELKKIREHIEQVRDQVVQMMDKVVKHVSDVTKQIELEREDRIDAEMARVASLKKVTERNVDLLHTIEQHGSERHKFVTGHQVKRQNEETDKQISEEYGHLKHLNAELVLADTLKKLIDITDVEKLVLMKLTESESRHTPIDPVPTIPRDTGVVLNFLRDSKLVRTGEHAVRSNTEGGPLYVGVSVCRDGRVILSDCSTGGYLHLYNPANTTELKLALDGPNCAVEIDDTNLAVSTGVDKTIHIVNVGNKMRINKTFKTQNKPRTIVALNNGRLAVSWSSPPGFAVIDISGKKLVQKLYLDQDTSGRKFKSFLYMAVDERKQHVIQPCSTTEAVYCFDYTGKPVFKYTHPALTKPQGVALDKCGNIYVCECNPPGSIHKLSPTGNPISVITEGIPTCPRAICSGINGTGFWVTDLGSNKVVYFRLEQKRNS